MKLSIAWIFDHIDADWRAVDIPALITTCIQTTAEIEDYHKVSVDLAALSLAEIKQITTTDITVFSAEWHKECTMPVRPGVSVGHYYLIKKDATWASMKDFSSDKDHLLPAVGIPELSQHNDNRQALLAGDWKKSFEAEDYILVLDNKSVTNRPDMWGHRGVAREFAAMLKLPLKPLSSCIANLTVEESTSDTLATQNMPFALCNGAPKACKRFAGLYIKQINHCSSILSIMHRLCRIDSRPIDALVDATNYVMFDMSQPLHAFDADRIATRVVEPRFACAQEKLALLDGSNVELTINDVVITDGEQPIALAGIMGGSSTSVTSATHSLFVESASFDATTIRLSAARHKIRTEASARFEKTLDPYQNVVGLKRFVKLLQDAGVSMSGVSSIVSCGPVEQQKLIQIFHAFIEQRLGVALTPDFVVTTLTALDFIVQTTTDGQYVVTVPSFRASKDINIKEDIVEEVGRYFGYANIVRVLPRIQVQGGDLTPTMRVRSLKQCMVDSLKMHELYNYAFYDEEFLRELQWDPGHTASVQSPVSEQWRRLVTTLVPGLCKAIKNNVADTPALRFFEWARTWHRDGDVITEKKALSGIIFDEKNTLDFYEAKALLQPLFTMLKVDIAWRKVDDPHQPWFMPYQTADLYYGDIFVGRVGKAHKLFLQTIAQGDAFIFELDGDFLMQYKKPLIKFVPLAKYPEVVRDMSMLIGLAHSVETITDHIKSIDKRIKNVTLIDFFEKPEWIGQRSLTFRMTIQDVTKTLSREETDDVMSRVVGTMQSLGGEIR